MLDRIQKSADFIKSKTNLDFKVGIILGSGLGNLGEEIKSECTLSYNEIPNFPVSTVEGHSGKLILGTLEGIPVIALQGRFHYYEGYSFKRNYISRQSF